MASVSDKRPQPAIVGQNQTLTAHSEMLDVLASPWSCIGAVAGLLIAVLVHCLAPSADAVQLGAWLVGLGWLAGLAWDLIGKDAK